jgi:uridine phosphorylase
VVAAEPAVACIVRSTAARTASAIPRSGAGFSPSFGLGGVSLIGCEQHNPLPLSAYLRPTAPIAPDVLLPGDPGLALALAQRLLERPRMANHSHGLWGYSGRTGAGRELTIQATGIGGPSAAVVVAELAGHGARRAVRIGPCSALVPGLAVGDAVVAGVALSADGASRALASRPPEPDPALTAAVARAAAAEAVTVVSSDLHHDPERARRRGRWVKAGARVADLESAAVLAAGARLGVACAAALVVAEPAGDERGEGDGRALERALVRAGEAAARALGGPQADQPLRSETSPAV